MELLKQELREPAVASGKTKMSEIASTVGVETGLCTKYLANLMTLGIIKQETPVIILNKRCPICSGTAGAVWSNVAGKKG